MSPNFEVIMLPKGTIFAYLTYLDAERILVKMSFRILENLLDLLIHCQYLELGQRMTD